MGIICLFTTHFNLLGQNIVKSSYFAAKVVCFFCKLQKNNMLPKETSLKTRCFSFPLVFWDISMFFTCWILASFNFFHILWLRTFSSCHESQQPQCQRPSRGGPKSSQKKKLCQKKYIYILVRRNREGWLMD